MLEKLGNRFSYFFMKYMPNAFVFALILTLLSFTIAFFSTESSPIDIVSAWYKGFFDLLSFTMQIVLMIITGYSIALSPIVKKGIDHLAKYIKTPTMVYFFVLFIGMLLALVSFGWIVITSVLARELAARVKGIHYPYLIACVYFSLNTWVFGFSSSIPLLLNTENNFLVEAELLNDVIPMTYTLQSSLNLIMIGLFLFLAPLVFLFLRPKNTQNKELKDLLIGTENEDTTNIKEEAKSMKLPFSALSDTLNNGVLVQLLIVILGFVYIVYHFMTKGFDLNFNIMIFIFLMVGMLLHKTPMRYVISMQRASGNISGILYQYPFYAGIMGIMLYTGLGDKLGQELAQVLTAETYPFFAYFAGGFVNFAIPSAGGEFAVVGPGLINALNDLGTNLSPHEWKAMLSRAFLAVAYGESLSNMLQPFFLLIVLPVLGKGVKIQARDIMGFLVIPTLLFIVIQILMVMYLPV